jgi:hypothetical protein
LFIKALLDVNLLIISKIIRFHMAALFLISIKNEQIFKIISVNSPIHNPRNLIDKHKTCKSFIHSKIFMKIRLIGHIHSCVENIYYALKCSMREHHLCSRRWNYRIVLAYFPDALSIVVLTCSHFILKILSNLLLSDYFLSPIVTKIFCKTIYKESININLKTNWLHLIK